MTSRFQLANALRALAIDSVQKAKSGHPGAPMGMADIAEVLWNDYLKHNPSNPNWVDRDRFVLSNGHGSMLIYGLLHLSGYDLSIEDLKSFRQMRSKTPGHPEYGYTPGVETTTGPLGQGIANAVGMALAEKILAAQFNRPNFNLVDHFTYTFLGDGCMMEGISHEVCSLAGTLGLSKLIALYDDNGISIDGQVSGWFSDDTAQRFAAYGWQVLRADGHNPEEIKAALEAARANTSQPSLIICKTIIGFGSPNKANTADSHGAPLGEEEIIATKKQLGWEYGPFEIPAEISQAWNAQAKGAAAEASWNELFTAYAKEYPELAAEFNRRQAGQLPDNFAQLCQDYLAEVNTAAASPATRKASLDTLNKFAPQLPELLGGSADLAPSNLTFWNGAQAVTAQDASGNYLHYGVREFGMAAIINGISLHGGFIPYGATFLIFMEYARNALRMAALMGIQHIEVFTHDSIGLGEDGPTHQPIEQLASLRGTPNMSVWRPADAVETVVAWQAALNKKTGPTALILSRQNLPHQTRTEQQLADIAKGGYILKDTQAEPEAIIIATGSEIGLAMQTAAALEAKGKHIRVVSLPCTDLFEQQDAEYKQKVLPIEVANRLVIEASHKDYWYKYAGLEGRILGMESFGESAPADQLFAEFGFSVDNAVALVEEMLEDLDD